MQPLDTVDVIMTVYALFHYATESGRKLIQHLYDHHILNWKESNDFFLINRERSFQLNFISISNALSE